VTKPGLAALIFPRTVAELAECYRRDEPVVVHGERDSVAALRTLPLVTSLDTLLGTWPETVQAHLPDVADESHSVSVSPHDARKMFVNGMSLLFDDVNRYAPELNEWLYAIRADLGLSALAQQRCLIYATPAGKGTAWHFDQNVNFVLQVHGTKTWWLAPNEHVSRPMTRHTIGQRVDSELQSYAKEPMLAEAPTNQREIVLSPGSLLFVPRGVWHSTRATTDALSLNFTFSPPTWIDLFTAALRSKLALSSAWRETAAVASVEVFDALLRELAAEAPHWNATDILEATDG
jgi:50S ribosomal protein L16 3-hydroxylase